MADEYISLAGKASPEKSEDYLTEYDSDLRVIFLSQLNSSFYDVDLEIMTKVDADYNVTGTEDPAIKLWWFQLSLRKNYTPAFEPAHQFISEQGGLGYLKAIYQALVDSDQRDLAMQWFEENIFFYHPKAIRKI